MSKRRPLVAGNWKMHGLKASVAEFGRIAAGYDAALKAKVDLLVCPPATLMSTLAVAALGTRIGIGGQDCHAKESGAYTGDIAAEMIADTGAVAVILGHSERRADHNETDAMARAKVLAAWRASLTAILCVGETHAERDAFRALDVVRSQLSGSLPDGATAANTVIAYEPVWAIGTGRTPTLGDIEEMHGVIRAELRVRFGDDADDMRLLYGGSVKPENAAEILAVADVDGALVGGASLKADTFLAIARAYL
ncbi:triosephosphate isomerase [Ancylobacter novellus DSM 506]|uniref:Triosephosphate isomerase n=1 Tax=Ancylobacter novellus (strain ATCC 8093 / DSM 506 / JCM 20403 / CCM 1077 / IAM 12100 / NBRC 12443 / NCIMB 10456) TaxID=639283 RepID=D6ZYK4_ANCN5|nr:triose-phosphate isomerase [Ancylobacter novellus]ADH89116.1 triosephosphate isomerase [Ancylobacter novellus DSM 506]